MYMKTNRVEGVKMMVNHSHVLLIKTPSTTSMDSVAEDMPLLLHNHNNIFVQTEPAHILMPQVYTIRTDYIWFQPVL